MKPLKFFNIILLLSITYSPAFSQGTDSIMLSKFFATALKEDHAYADLHDLCKQCSPRLSGSDGAQKAVDLTKKILQDAGADTVWLQEVMVPHWVRGEKEQAKINSSTLKLDQAVPVCALGGSIGTAKEGIKAHVIEVKGLGQLAKLNPADIKGKIVFYDKAFDASLTNTFDAYGKAVAQRWGGAMEAAKYGAIGVVVRTMASHVDNWPHTGSMGYKDSIPKIPAIAISTKAADLLDESLKKDKDLTFFFKTFCQTLPDVKSYNVIGELKGTESPKEIIVIGGHLDAWDLAEGAQDDGAGVVQSIEVLRLFKTLEIKPKKTIRVVLFMNEENGGKGAKKYAEWAKTSGEKHITAIETDEGGFTPRGFTLQTSEDVKDYILLKWKPLMDEFDIGDLKSGGSGADVGDLAGNCTLLAGLHPDPQRYFDFHHAANDIWENVDDRELELGASALASFIYLIDKYGLGDADKKGGGNND